MAATLTQPGTSRFYDAMHAIADVEHRPLYRHGHADRLRDILMDRDHVCAACTSKAEAANIATLQAAAQVFINDDERFLDLYDQALLRIADTVIRHLEVGCTAVYRRPLR